MKRSWVGEQKGSKGEVDDSGRGPRWERRGVWSPGFQRGMGVGGQLSRGLNSWSLKCPMEESSRPASRGGRGGAGAGCLPGSQGLLDNLVMRAEAGQLDQVSRVMSEAQAGAWTYAGTQSPACSVEGLPCLSFLI